MGIIDRIKKLFRGSETIPIIQEDDSYEKSMLATKIVNSIDKIKRIDSFDSSIWNLSNVTKYDLERKSLGELKRLQASLESRETQLTRQSQRINPEMEALEASKWTGQKPKNMTDHDFDRWQRD